MKCECIPMVKRYCRREMDVAMKVSATPHGAGEARRRLRVLERELPESAYSSLRLLVSELVSNKPSHVGQAVADESLHLVIHTSEDGVRVELHDTEHARPERAQTAAQEELSRWDVVLLDELTSGWGILEDSASDVWFEILYDDPSS